MRRTPLLHRGHPIITSDPRRGWTAAGNRGDIVFGSPPSGISVHNAPSIQVSFIYHDELDDDKTCDPGIRVTDKLGSIGDLNLEGVNSLVILRRILDEVSASGGLAPVVFDGWLEHTVEKWVLSCYKAAGLESNGRPQ